VLAQQLACTDVGQPEVVLQPFRLRALSGARGAEEDEVQFAYFKNPS
jgi:hypothetical protein